MIEDNYDDEQILKDIFLKSIELADPAKKIDKIKIDPPSGRLFFAAVGKGAGRLAKVFEKSFPAKADGIVVIPENEKCDELECEVIKATHPIPSQKGLDASYKLLKAISKLGGVKTIRIIKKSKKSHQLEIYTDGSNELTKEDAVKALAKAKHYKILSWTKA